MIKINKKSYEAICKLKKNGFSNYAIIEMLCNPKSYDEISEVKIINESLGQGKTHPDELIEGLVNGFEVIPEETKRQKINEIIQKFYGYPISEALLDQIEKVAKDQSIDWC